eukprot:TRINITY_DN4993_c0_g1_i1.p1 TRINITY_DN4993_c0_g1~~TRINITY_DN4993_c0_g1_i1.p1  ORF type:complete len:806 (+),score=146.94 TRINITY_DN4993_c0_g1_i1:82-2499(+)
MEDQHPPGTVLDEEEEVPININSSNAALSSGVVSSVRAEDILEVARGASVKSDSVTRTKSGLLKRSNSQPSVPNVFNSWTSDSVAQDKVTRDISAQGAKLDKSTRDLLREVMQEEGDTVLQRAEQWLGDSKLRSLGHVYGMRQSLAAGAARVEADKKNGRVVSKEEIRKEHGHIPKTSIDCMDWATTGIIGFLALVVVIVMCIWTENGLLPEDHIGHHVVVKSPRAEHLASPMYITPAEKISLESAGKLKDFFEVRIITMSSHDFSYASHRRLAGGSSKAKFVGNLTYSILADGEVFFEKTVKLLEAKELEHFQTVDVAGKGKNNAKEYSATVTAQRSDGQQVAFMMQVIRMGESGKWREVIGIIIFAITFVSIVTEKINKIYCAFLGASAALTALSAFHTTPHLHEITAMIDFGTLMLLFSMMILMRMLAVTGFFNWFAIKIVCWTRQNPKLLFYALTNICGILSMFLDNVTCVLLFGPLVINIAAKMKLSARYLYLSMTICATIGGTATYIGDPPNIVIGSKLNIGFEKFLIYNFPLVLFLFLPISSAFLYWRCKDKLDLTGGAREKLDLVKLQEENKITSPVMFAKLTVVLFAILVSLLLAPLHKIEPAWFTVMAMFACAILFERHDFGKYLHFVEWETLMFFALLFVLVETLKELGVILLLAEGITNLIKTFHTDARLTVAIIIILWVSSLGSAFLESLPYTTTIVSVLESMRESPPEGVNPEVLVWPLSVGACVGGIGSIMGSSANLVCISVSKRFAQNEEDQVTGGDFLKYGLPIVFILGAVCTVWQLVIFVAAGINPA